jgi:hypothetical protein
MKGGRRGLPVKTLKRFLKKAGLKVSGKKAALTRRAKKAGLRIGGGDMGEMKMMGGVDPEDVEAMGGRRRNRRRKLIMG